VQGDLAVLEERPGRVFVAALADAGSAVKARGAVLPGDRLVAVEGVDVADMSLDAVMEHIGAASNEVYIVLSRDSTVLAVAFDGCTPIAAQAGEPLRNLAVRAGARVKYDCESGRYSVGWLFPCVRLQGDVAAAWHLNQCGGHRCGTCEHRIGPAGPLAKYARVCLMPLVVPPKSPGTLLVLLLFLLGTYKRMQNLLAVPISSANKLIALHLDTAYLIPINNMVNRGTLSRSIRIPMNSV
jgi:ferredoxin